MKINKYIAPIIAIVILFVAIGISMLINYWKTDASPEEKLGLIEGVLNPDNLKGSAVIQDILNEYKLDKDTFYNDLGIPSDIPISSKVKDLKEKEIIEIDGIREYLKNKLNDDE